MNTESNIENNAVNELAWNIAQVVMGMGLIGLVVWLCLVPLMELLNWFLLVWVPILGILVGTGLVSMGTYNGIKDIVMKGGFVERVKAHREDIKSKETSAA